jgi:protein required for attachment to host cells
MDLSSASTASAKEAHYVIDALFLAIAIIATARSLGALRQPRDDSFRALEPDEI